MNVSVYTLRVTSVFSLTIFTFIVLAGCKKDAPPPQAAAGPPVVPVSATKVVEQAVPTELHIVGTVEASAIVQVKSQIAGELTSGQFHRRPERCQGRPAVQHRSASLPGRAAHRPKRRWSATRRRSRRPKPSLARDTAQAKFAEADAALQTELRKGGLASKSQSDQSRVQRGRRARHRRRPPRRPSKAPAPRCVPMRPRSRTAKLNLSYCEIHAPISGRTGNLLVHRRQSGQGQRRAAGGHPPGRADLRRISAFRSSTWRAIRRLSAHQKLAVRVTPQDDPGPHGSGVALGHRQHGGYRHRHHPAEGDVRQSRRHAVAGPVRQRRC